MITMFFSPLLAWLPLPLFLIASGIVGMFFLSVMLHLIAFIIDIIPFL